MLVGKGIDRVAQYVVDSGYVSVAVGNVHVDGAVDLNKHLKSVFKQLKSTPQVTWEKKKVCKLGGLRAQEENTDSLFFLTLSELCLC